MDSSTRKLKTSLYLILPLAVLIKLFWSRSLEQEMWTKSPFKKKWLNIFYNGWSSTCRPISNQNTKTLLWMLLSRKYENEKITIWCKNLKGLKFSCINWSYSQCIFRRKRRKSWRKMTPLKWKQWRKIFQTDLSKKNTLLVLGFTSALRISGQTIAHITLYQHSKVWMFPDLQQFVCQTW